MLACQRPPTRRREPILYPEGMDGRQVCDLTTAEGKREYKRRTEVMWERQNALCSICQLPMRLEEATFEHQDGRGHGGGHRDDRIEIDGKPHNSVAHGFCNVEKGSVRLDAYMSRLERA